MTIKHYRGSLINDDFSVVPNILSSCSLTRITEDGRPEHASSAPVRPPICGFFCTSWIYPHTDHSPSWPVWRVFIFRELLNCSRLSLRLGNPKIHDRVHMTSVIIITVLLIVTSAVDAGGGHTTTCKSVACSSTRWTGFNSPCGICGAYSSAEKGFSQSRRNFPSFRDTTSFPYSHFYRKRAGQWLGVPRDIVSSKQKYRNKTEAID